MTEGDPKKLKKALKQAARRFPGFTLEGGFSQFGDPVVFIYADELPPGPYEVLLDSTQNVDLMFSQAVPGATPGYWLGARPLARSWAPAASLEDAAKVVRMMIDGHGLGGGNWTGGDVRIAGDDKGTVVARISYNGRAWLPGKWPTPEVRW